MIAFTCNCNWCTYVGADLASEVEILKRG